MTPCQILGHRFCLFVFFVFLVLPRETKKKKKTKVLTPCQILGHRFCLFVVFFCFVFFVFRGFGYWDMGSVFFFGFTSRNQKKQKKQKYWPHARYWDIGSAFLFFFLVFRGFGYWDMGFAFLFFWFYLEKPKKTKKTKVLTPCQILGHRFCLFFLFFRGFGYWDMGSVILFFLFFRGFWSLSANAYMGFAGLKTVKKVHCHGVLFWKKNLSLSLATIGHSFVENRQSKSLLRENASI